ncbi:hypothetical protein AB4K20DRAFT_1987379 [Rhizopus microsporus]
MAILLLHTCILSCNACWQLIAHPKYHTGANTTFFFMKSLAGMYVLCEVSKVRIPTTKQDIVQLASCLDDLFAISCLHSSISKESGESVIKAPILPMACVEGKKKSILGKRRVSAGSIAGSSSKC